MSVDNVKVVIIMSASTKLNVKPAVSDVKMRKLLDDIYSGQGKKSQLGNGTIEVNTVNFEYSNANNLLISEFAEMKVAYESDLESYGDGHEDSCYGLYEREFALYTLKQLQHNNEPRLEKIFKFIEKLMSSGDSELVNMVAVAVIERLYFENVCDDYKDILLKFCGKETLQSFVDCFCEEELLEWNRHKPEKAA